MDILERAMESLGIDEDHRIQLGYYLAQGYYWQSINGTHACFYIETKREYRRVRTLMYEHEVLQDIIETASFGDVFYDIGANIGVHTCFVGQHVDQVIAFDPHGPTAAKLRKNAELNDIPVTVYEYALADKAGTATLSLPSDTPQALGTGEFTLQEVEQTGQGYQADIIPGDELAKAERMPLPDIAKVDVEGAEMETLRGFSSTLQNCRVLYVEVHLDHVSIETVQDQLMDLGFQSELLKDRGNTAFLKTQVES